MQYPNGGQRARYYGGGGGSGSGATYSSNNTYGGNYNGNKRYRSSYGNQNGGNATYSRSPLPPAKRQAIGGTYASPGMARRGGGYGRLQSAAPRAYGAEQAVNRQAIVQRMLAGGDTYQTAPSEKLSAAPSSSAAASGAMAQKAAQSDDNKLGSYPTFHAGFRGLGGPRGDQRPFSIIQHNYQGAAYTPSTAFVPVDEAWVLSGAGTLAIQNWSNLAALFNQYRLRKVRVRGFPRINTSNNTIYSTSPSPLIFTCINYNKKSGLTQISDMTQYENFRAHNQFKPWQRTIYPHCSMSMITSSTTATSVGSTYGQWVSTGTAATMEWYSLTVGMDAQSGSTHPPWDAWRTYYIQFKNIF